MANIQLLIILLVVGKSRFLLFFNEFILLSLAKFASSALVDVLLVLCGLADNLRRRGEVFQVQKHEGTSSLSRLTICDC